MLSSLGFPLLCSHWNTNKHHIHTVLKVISDLYSINCFMHMCLYSRQLTSHSGSVWIILSACFVMGRCVFVYWKCLGCTGLWLFLRVYVYNRHCVLPSSLRTAKQQQQQSGPIFFPQEMVFVCLCVCVCVCVCLCLCTCAAGAHFFLL